MFIERLLSLINEKGIKKKDLINALGIGKNQINYWKDNNTIPNKVTQKAIADYFGVSVEYLLGETDEKKPPQEGASDNIITEERLKALGIDTSQLYDLTDNELEIIRTTLHALVENFKKNK